MPSRHGPAGPSRCAWAEGVPEFTTYHDDEWGRPVTDDRQLFEKLSLEAFQSGLSWRTILAKREGFRAAFADFDIEAVARFGEADVSRLLSDARIVRHRGKIEAVVNNARRAAELIDETGGLATHVWSFEPDPATLPEPQSRSTSLESVALSKDLRRRGWRFVGPTTAFAFMQAMGLLNDHETTCAVRPVVEAERMVLVRPEATRP